MRSISHSFIKFQSGFRATQSTETALLKITNNLFRPAESGLITILILLKLSKGLKLSHIQFSSIDFPLLALLQPPSIGSILSSQAVFSSFSRNLSILIPHPSPPVFPKALSFVLFYLSLPSFHLHLLEIQH